MSGVTQSVAIIAEAGVNHNGDVAAALRLVDAAAEAGADFVKFQTFDPDLLATPDADKAAYQVQTTGDGESQRDMLKKLVLSKADHRRLKTHCSDRGIEFLSTPFDNASVDMLLELDVPAIKISSGDLTNHLLLRHVASTGKPMIVSTGMATIAEIADAMDAMRDAGAEDITLLHCVTDYPADPADANLRAIAPLANRFGVPAGYSDHTRGITVAVAAAALGAVIIEKHITLDRTLPGPDQQASLEPEEFAALVSGIRTVERALGTGEKIPSARERRNVAAARRSLVSARGIAKDAVITAEDLTVMRPGTGMPPAAMDTVVGRKTNRAIAPGTVLTEDMLS
jgi:N,N'-diacetyllegionaminate synthase